MQQRGWTEQPTLVPAQPSTAHLYRSTCGGASARELRDDRALCVLAADSLEAVLAKCNLASWYLRNASTLSALFPEGEIPEGEIGLCSPSAGETGLSGAAARCGALVFMPLNCRVRPDTPPPLFALCSSPKSSCADEPKASGLAAPFFSMQQMRV